MKDIRYKAKNGYISFDPMCKTVFYCDKTVTAVDIPPEINGIRVERISDHAFAFNPSIKKIGIPSTVRDIGDDAFLGCSALEGFDVDKDNPRYLSVDGILYSSDFEIDFDRDPIDFDLIALIACGCGYKKKDVELISDTSYFEYNAFRGCANIESIKLPEGLKFISPYAFGSCERLKSINIPQSVDRIPEKAFADCISLKKIELPESVIKISRGAFEGCAALETVIIKNPRTYIEPTAFCGCRQLKNKAQIDKMIKDNAAYRIPYCEDMLDDWKKIV